MGMMGSGITGAGYTPNGDALGTFNMAKNQKQEQQMKAMDLMMKSMAVKKGRQEMEVAEEQHKVNLGRARAMAQNVGKYTEADMLQIDNNIGALKGEMEGRKLQETASIVSAMLESADDETYRKGLEQLQKKGVNTQELGLGKGYRQDIAMMEYIKNRATTDQQYRQKEKLMNVDAKNNMDAAILHGGIQSDIQTQKDKAAMDRLLVQMGAEARQAAAKAIADIGIPAELTKYGAREQENLTTSLTSFMMEGGWLDPNDAVTDGAATEQKLALKDMAVDGVQEMYRMAKVFAEAGQEPNMAVLRQMVESKLVGQVDSNGVYHRNPDSSVLRKDRAAWGVKAAARMAAKYPEKWGNMSEAQKKDFIMTAWSNPKSRKSSNSADFDRVAGDEGFTPEKAPQGPGVPPEAGKSTIY